MLRVAYHPEAASDSHPNRLANEEIGPLFVEFIIESIEEYRATEDR